MDNEQIIRLAAIKFLCNEIWESVYIGENPQYCYKLGYALGFSDDRINNAIVTAISKTRKKQISQFGYVIR